MKTKIAIFALLFVFLNASLLIIDCFGQWSSDVRLTNATGISSTSYNNAWCIAANGNVVHIVWSDIRDGNKEIYYKRSTDGGLNWGADSRLTNNTANSEYPSIAVSGSNVQIVWQENRDADWEIYYKRSTDGGLNWGADTRLTNNAGFSYNPSLAVSGSNVHLVWCDVRDGNYEIYYKRSTDGGTSWAGDLRLTNDSTASFDPSVSVSGSYVHVTWFDDGTDEIYHKRSTDGGINWGAATRLTIYNGESYRPCIAVSGLFVHVVWQDNRISNNEIYYKRSTNGGVNWEGDKRLTDSIESSYMPSIAVSGSNVHIVWFDFRYYNDEIYYKRSTDFGVSWDSDLRLTNNILNSWYPSVAVSGPVIHVVWVDDRDGNYEVYYKRNPTGNPTGIQNISTEIPAAFSLSQNYPNPFNPGTVVRFDVMRSQTGALGADKVVLKVYDVMGREVETLVNEQLAPGTYEAKFDGSKLNSGVYFYRLQSGSFTETKQMMLIK